MGAGGLEHPTGHGRHAACRSEGDYRVLAWPRDDASTGILRVSVNYFELYRRSVTRFLGKDCKVEALEAVLKFVVAMTWKAHYYPTVSEDDLTHTQAVHSLTGGYLDAFVEEVGWVIKITCTGNACQRVHQVRTSFFSFLDEDDWAGKLKTEGSSRLGIG